MDVRFHESMEMKGLSEEMSDEDKVVKSVNILCERLELPDFKVQASKVILDQLNFTRFKKSDWNNKGFDHVLVAGAVVYSACRTEPVIPRWKKLIASECREMCKERGRSQGAMRQGVDSYWNRGLRNMISMIKEEEGIDLDPVSAVDIVYYVSDSLELPRVIEGYCLRKMALLSNIPSFQGKDRVVLSAALAIYSIEQHDIDVSYDIPELADSLCVNERTVEEHIELIGEYLD